jgi:LL-diaminopimelate aminotransferase
VAESQGSCDTLRTAWSCRYGAEQGQGPLREALAATFYPGMRGADEIFVSDGSKCDIARIQV